MQRYRISDERPKRQLIDKAADHLNQHGFVVCPTETSYVFLCLPEATKAVEEIRRWRNMSDHHLWSLLCGDISQASELTLIDNARFRLLKRYLPGPYTFILPSRPRLPRRLFGKRHDVGVRMSSHEVCAMLVEQADQPLLATTVQWPDADHPENDPDMIDQYLASSSHIFLDAGWLGMDVTTVVDLTEDESVLVRQGMGDWKG